MAGIARFSVVALDCADPRALAQFYAAITGWEIDHDDGDWVQLGGDDGATLAFQRAPGHHPPVWPSDDHPQQAHLDFDVPDLDVGEQQVMALGARKADLQPGSSFRVYLDPAGHPFCLVLDETMAQKTQHQRQTEEITMVDGGATGDGGTGDWGSPAGTNMSPTHENCVVVEPPGNAGILTAPDGSSYVLLPRQPARPEEDLSGGPPGPRDSTAVT